MMVLKPEKVMFHCIKEPRGYWWDRILDWEGWEDDHGERKWFVEIHRARDVDFIGSSLKPVHHVGRPSLPYIGHLLSSTFAVLISSRSWLTLLAHSPCPFSSLILITR